MKQPASAAGCSRNRAERAGERVDAFADPCRMQLRQRLQQSCERRRAPARRAATADRADRRTRPRATTARWARTPARHAVRLRSWRRAPRRARAPSGPGPRSTSTTVVASVFDPAGPRRVANPDDVAADVARQEVVEERRRPGTNRAACAADIGTSCASSSRCHRQVLAMT